MTDRNRENEPALAPLPRARFSLRWKLALLAIGVAAVPLAAIGIYLVADVDKELREVDEELLAATLEEFSGSVHATLREVAGNLELLGRTLTDDTGDVDTRLGFARAIVAATTDLVAVGIYDEHGRFIDAIDKADKAGTPESRAEMADALPPALLARAREAAGETRFVTGEAERAGDATRVLVVVPFRAREVLWFAVGYASLDAVQTRAEQLSQRFRGAAQVYLVDERARALVHTDAEYTDALHSMADHGLLRDVQTRQRIGLLGASRNDRGVKVIGMLRPVEGTTWRAGAEVPTSRALLRVRALQRAIFISIVASIILAVAVAVWLSGRITRPIRSLVGFAGDLAQRRFDRRVKIETTDELSVLGSALSRAASDLEASDAKIREEQAIRSDMGRYLPEQLVDKIARREQSLALGGERVEITVLFADVASFTPLAERHSADEVVAILNQLFTVLTEVVFRHGGTVDKFIGDCVMAFWGAPTPRADHAARALAAAEDMLRWLEVANESWQARYGVTIHLAIGVNTGEAIVGNFGSESRMEYTAIGDAVNVAARLESIARPQQILISAATAAAAGDRFSYLDLGQHQLAGRMEPVTLHEVRI